MSRREDATPYDGPACRRCGRDVETDGALCEECVEERQDRHEALLSERRWLVGSEA